MRALAIGVILAFSAVGCATPDVGGSKEVRGGVSQAELQEDLQRFVSQFLERVIQSSEPIIQSDDRSARNAVLQQIVRIASSSLDIAAGPFPEVNLLDMMTFIRLTGDIVEQYWIPRVYGPAGQGLRYAFRASRQDLAKIEGKLLKPEERELLDGLVRSWRNENPGLVRVEWIRLSDFSRQVGKIQSARADQASGLLASVKGAVVSADEAALAANRALFVGLRMPGLLRLQARIGVQEILADSMEGVRDAGRLPAQARPVVQDLSAVLVELGRLLEQAGPFMADFRKYFPRDPRSTMAHKLAIGERLTGNLRALVAELNAATPAARSHLDGLIWTAALALVAVGAAWVGLWWLGYYLVKRRYGRTS